MIEDTVFKDNSEIINFVKEVYSLEITSVKKLNRGSANIYSLNNDEYILKEFQSKYTEEEINKETIVINHLRKYDIQVPEYIETINSEFYTKYKDRIIIIQRFIEGSTLDNNTGTYNQVIECAEIYGKIVSALKTLPIDLPEFEYKSWFSEESLNKSIKNYEELIGLLKDNETDNIIKNDLLEKISMINDIKESLDCKNLDKLTIMNSHGDYSVLQFIYKDGKVNSVIDFVSASKLPVVWELIRSYSYIYKDAKDGEFNLDTFSDYINTFNKYVKLNEYDLKYMPYLYLVQILKSSYGYKQYIMDHTKKELLEFGYLRTKICRYLFKNAKTISDKLTR